MKATKRAGCGAVAGPVESVGTRLHAAVEVARLGMAEWLPGVGILHPSARWQAQVGDESSDTRGAAWLGRVHGEDRAGLEDRLKAWGAAGGGEELEYRLGQGVGGWRWMRIRGLPAPGGKGQILLFQVDITAEKSLHGNPADAPRDSLTGLPGRQALYAEGESLIEAARRAGRLLAVLYIDLDDFKAVNDRYGHCAGDQVLQEMGLRLPAALRSGDLAGRLGDNEFLVVLADIRTREDAARVAIHILQTLSRPCIYEGASLATPPSIGLSIFPADGTDMDALVEAAGQAMEEAKGDGGQDFRFFTEGMRGRNMDAAEGDLRKALAEGMLDLHFQAVLDTASQQVAAAEAFVRLRQPDGSLLAPDAFLPLAERCGLLPVVENWVLLEACRQQQAWAAAGLPPIPVEVNISPLQFRQPDFQGLLQHAIAETHMDPALLWLDVTEDALMSHIDETVEALHVMRNCGVRVSLDHFGRGFTSLSHLRRLPVDRVKIDQSLVRELVGEPVGTSLGEAILALSRSLKLEVVAEGVETRQDLESVIRRGCARAQGNFLHRPMASADFLNWWRGRM